MLAWNIYFEKCSFIKITLSELRKENSLYSYFYIMSIKFCGVIRTGEWRNLQ